MEPLTLSRVAQIGAILITILIITTPVLYPRYSLFAIRGRQGLEKLQEKREEQENITAGYLSEGENGFRQIRRVVTEVYEIRCDMSKIWFVIGDNPEDIGEFGKVDIQYGIGSNAAILGEDTSGEMFIIHYEPWSPNRVWDLEFLWDGLERIAQSRSHYLMIVLAVLWGTLSIITAF